jgi:diaminopimelate decarboxylase
MLHFSSENSDAPAFLALVDAIAQHFGDIITRMDRISLGGGISSTLPESQLDTFADGLRAFAERFGVQVYLEPGDAVVTGAGELVTTVLDVVHNCAPIAIDAAAGCTIVKASWFNGLPRPTIAVRRLDGSVEVLPEFGYADFHPSLSRTTRGTPVES